MGNEERKKKEKEKTEKKIPAKSMGAMRLGKRGTEPMTQNSTW